MSQGPHAQYAALLAMLSAVAPSLPNPTPSSALIQHPPPLEEYSQPLEEDSPPLEQHCPPLAHEIPPSHAHSWHPGSYAPDAANIVIQLPLSSEMRQVFLFRNARAGRVFVSLPPIATYSDNPSGGPFISKLPVELLLQIFEKVFDEYTVTNVESGPWGLSRVCNVWRSIVFATPRLWTNVHIPDKATARCDRLLGFALLRTSGRPLNIRFQDLAGSRMHWQNLEMLIQASHAWKSASFCFQSPDSLEQFERIAGRIANLETVVLRVDHSVYEPRTVAQKHYGLRVAPKLRAVKVDVPDFIFPLPRTVTNYTEDYSGIKAEKVPLQVYASAIVGRLVRLQKLDFTGFILERRNHRTYPLFSLPHLSHLVISDPRIASLLKAPQLEDVMVLPTRVGAGRSSDSMLRALYSMIQVSGCSLQSLIIEECLVRSASDLIDLLRILPTLTQLELTFLTFRSVDPVLLEMMEAMKAPELIPKLASFRLSVAQVPPTQPTQEESTRLEFIGAPLVGIVKARRPVLAHVDVDIIVPDDVETSVGRDSLEKWCSMKEEGLEAHIAVAGGIDKEHCPNTNGQVTLSYENCKIIMDARIYV